MRNLTLSQIITGAICLFAIAFQAQADIKPLDVVNNMQKVADWQIEHFRDKYSGRDKPHHIRDWTNGALYVGMLKWAQMSGDPRYQQWLKDIADRGDWELHWRKYMADDHVVGQLYLDLYRQYKDAAMLRPTQARFDDIMANPSDEPIELNNYANLERWTWCDALFMAPPVWAKLSNITGNPVYRDWMFEEFQATTDHLFDPKEGLYYRDNSYIGKVVNGEKVFWARGNGWVFAGLTLVMDEIPRDSAQFSYYQSLYLQMAKTLKRIQTPQGHWAMSLLDAKSYPTPETSGTSFFAYGFAWGINNGLLTRKEYLPTIERAWESLTSHITPDGMLGYVQPIGAAPGSAWQDKTEVYGTGAFLSAGSEIYKLIGGRMPIEIAPSTGLDFAIKKTSKQLEAEYAKKP